MEKSVLAFVLIIMVFAVLFFGLVAARDASGHAWPFAVVAAAACLGLGLARDRG